MSDARIDDSGDDVAEQQQQQQDGTRDAATASTDAPHDKDAAVAVYAALREAPQAAVGSLAPLPAYTLYKTAREEELCCYRGLCRVLAMHYGVDAALPKAPRRLLEDVGEVLCIPHKRAAIEWQTATSDAVVCGVARSRVLQQRGEFYDGVDDISVAEAVARAVDDGRVVYTQHESKDGSRTHNNSNNATTTTTHVLADGSAAGTATATSPSSRQSSVASMHTTTATTAAATTMSRPARKRGNMSSIVSSIARTGKEIEEIVQQYLYCTEARVQGRLLQTLEEKRQALLQLRQEVNDATA